MTDIVTILSGASANATGSTFDTGDLKDGAALEVTTAGTVSAFTVQLQGSLEGVNWFSIGSALTTASTSAELTGFLARYFRAVLSGFSGTGTVTARIGVETGAGFPSLAQLDSRYLVPRDFTQPAGATAATMPRWAATAISSALAPGTLYVAALSIAAGVTVGNITMMTGTTAKTGGTHGWYVLLDSGLVVRAVTADQIDPATVWGVQKAFYTLPTNSFTTTYSGLYYAGVMVAETSGTMPTFAASAIQQTAAISLAPPVFAGASSTSQTTPPAPGTTMGALTGGFNFNFYAYTS